MLYAVLLFALFALKHFIADFVIQTPYQYLNKGTLWHPGGLLHSFYHVVLSALAFTVLYAAGATLNPLVVILLLVGEFVVHYAIDYAKTNINRHYGWKCNETDNFWILTGADQFAHYMTYVGMVFIALL